MWYWPKLQLTDYEKQHVGIYKTDTKPGVLRRSYQLQLASIAQPDNNIPTIKTIDKYQIARRSRIFAITFSGNIDMWRLSVSNTNGTQYTNPSQRSQAFPVVSSLIAGSYYNALSVGGAGLFSTPSLQYLGQSDSVGPNQDFSYQFSSKVQMFPWIIEPNWVCQPNETIIFQGVDIAPTWFIAGESDEEIKLRTVLNITVYSWEFPGMSK